MNNVNLVNEKENGVIVNSYYQVKNNSTPSKNDKQIEALNKFNLTGEIEKFNALNSRLKIKQINGTNVLVDFSTNRPIATIPNVR